jgi:predicted DNA-binding transcriptional regulator YafY
MAEINAQLPEILKGIMKREKVSAEKLAQWCKVSPTSFRRMLRDEIKMDVDILARALDELGYKIMIVKKEDIV